MSEGASVFLYMPKERVGEALHRLEYHADIHIVERYQIAGTPFERWTLRSLIFPIHWDGFYAAIEVDEPTSGISRFLIPDLNDELLEVEA